MNFAENQDPVELTDTETPDESSIRELQDGLAAAKEENQALREQLKRAQADYDNFRRRLQEDADRRKEMAAEEIICELLEVLDHLEMAVGHSTAVNHPAPEKHAAGKHPEKHAAGKHPAAGSHPAAEPQEVQKKAVLEGIELIYRQIRKILEKQGLEEIPAEGCEFDPFQHDAVEAVETKTQPDNQVHSVLRRGYKLKNKVIRPSMVKVCRNINAKEDK